MSESGSEAGGLHMVLVGATGLIGREIMARSGDHPDIRLTAIARREVPLPQGARMEMIIADPKNWRQVIAQLAPDVLVSALGTTWKKANRDEAAFQAVDLDLVVQCAEGASDARVRQFIGISSVGADRFSKNLYLRTKGEMEQAVKKLAFARVDMLRPGLLKGKREDDPRGKERLAAVLSPLTDLFMNGSLRQYRSMPAGVVADAIYAMTQMRADGRFVHDNDAIHAALTRRTLRRPALAGE
ncbi:NAD(P)H-binding protein [Croceicoccus sp. Ery5]|uniref:NAD(P)H-binding protein n=1 Tax=Croceicoccus sp. Ery5 TaxID=1703340 RepID=UPI001E4F9054|nr:NAD(P)H-binding protein [Croceicoccus sp. Ery5]